MTTKQPFTRFTKSKLASLPAGDHTDPAVAGLQLRVRTGKSKITRTWLLRYKLDKRPLRIVIGHLETMGLKDAREKASRLRGGLDDGIDPRRAEPRRRDAPAAQSRSPTAAGDKYSIEFLAQEFLERHVKPQRKRPEYVAAILNKDVLSKDGWKGRDARSIKPREVIELLDGIVARGSPVAANRTAAVLGQMFKFGIHRAIVDDSPVKLLMRPGGKEKPRERALTQVELKAFLQDPVDATRFKRLAHVILILLLTGQRRGELTGARWRDIDLKAKTWRVPPENSKTAKEHMVPLSDWAVAEFRELKIEAGRSPWVLPGKDAILPLEAKLLTRGVAKCQARFKALGISGFTLHDLRRTCRTGLAQLKIEPHIAERVLGHSMGKIERTYDTHAYLDERRDALDKWAAHLEGLRP